MKYALLKKGEKTVVNVVDNIFEIPDDYVFIECDATVQSGTIYENGEFVSPQIMVPLGDAQMAKLAELNTMFDTASKNAYLMSSLGFEVDANEIANRNIEGLVLVMSDTDTTMFCDYNNEFHKLTKQQLETLRKEIVYNSQRLYQKKWALREQINAATTHEALSNIDVYALLDVDNDSV